jgi:hypothetical protein
MTISARNRNTPPPGRTGLRYAINWASADQLPALIAEGRRTVRDAMVEAFVLEKW